MKVTMRKIYEHLFVGTDSDCFDNKTGWATVHACKSPCHQRAVGYRGSLPSSHPHYLVLEKGPNLYLNMIDPPQPLFMMPLFTNFLAFARNNWHEGKNILIHCNLGESRAPSLALLFLAKIGSVIPNDSFDSAHQEYRKIDPHYYPRQGIQIYLRKNWEEL